MGAIDKRAAEGDLEAYGELLKNGAGMVQTDYSALLMKYLKSKHTSSIKSKASQEYR